MHTKVLIFILYFLFCFCLGSCSAVKFAGYYISSDNNSGGSLNGRIFSSEKTNYRIGKLSENWKRVKRKEGGLFFINSLSEAVITVNSTCKPSNVKFSLKALAESLTIGIKNKKLIERDELRVDNEDALYSKYITNVDGKIVNIATVVFKKSECVYDFSISSVGLDFDPVLEIFFGFVSEFEVLQRK